MSSDRRVSGDDRCAARSGFEQHQPDGLSQRGHDHRVGAAVGVGKFGRGSAAGEGGRESGEPCMQTASFRTVADEGEMPREPALLCGTEHVGQQVEILLRCEPSDTDDVRQAIGNARPDRDGAGRRRRAEGVDIDARRPQSGSDPEPGESPLTGG
ncbi:hypothetical protein GCM10022236_40990 [Microlunatus ginsengisoli]|uniref:Uncharacterized protein n=1 Tax=Microlunatus ginsengisoli TaxID=363863 RepID=A0ABP7AKF6_9ACTN